MITDHTGETISTTIGGQSAPPSLKVGVVPLGCDGRRVYRGAVRPPFIEGHNIIPHNLPLDDYRGAVRPPFIEGVAGLVSLAALGRYRGAVRPPFIEGLLWTTLF